MTTALSGWDAFAIVENYGIAARYIRGEVLDRGLDVRRFAARPQRVLDEGVVIRCPVHFGIGDQDGVVFCCRGLLGESLNDRFVDVLWPKSLTWY